MAETRQLTYAAVHRHLSEERGRAAEFPCFTCGSQAAEWAYDGSDPNERIDATTGLTFSANHNHYRPLCRSCHRFEDTRRAGRAGCGTDAGYYSHRRRGTRPCGPCKTAHAVAAARRLAAKHTPA